MIKTLAPLFLCILFVQCGDDLMEPILLPAIESYVEENYANQALPLDTSGIYYILGDCRMWVENIDTLKMDSVIVDSVLLPLCGPAFIDSTNTVLEYQQVTRLTDERLISATQANKRDTLQFIDLLPGLRKCLPLMKKGQEGLFFIPSDQGYGTRGSINIPPEADLIINFTLTNFWIDTTIENR